MVVAEEEDFHSMAAQWLMEGAEQVPGEVVEVFLGEQVLLLFVVGWSRRSNSLDLDGRFRRSHDGESRRRRG